ncbi:peptidylprolyl isomerase [Bizionia arctica]|uniref:PpiC domain-containing protein n=1 Tax=Bizionia arctica TaxID=1495645 RepID=A0A917GJY5_9FLAO|nr:peptidylprolyl isomerase [Bizionia arctica]GGG48761.1 hypothetical protein GCM10010976_20150 [Bizionia arctica]
MKRFLILIILITSTIQAQEKKSNELDLISDTNSAETYLKTNKKKGNKLITFNEEKHKSALTEDLFKLSVGGKTTVESNYEITTYKVVEKNSITHYRMSYILLDSKTSGAEKTKQYRDRIVKSYKSGAPMDFLAVKYSVADNANQGGDTGWFTKEDMGLFFDLDVTENNHSENDIYTLDNDATGHYYIIVNTYQPKEIQEIKVLKIVEPRN